MSFWDVAKVIGEKAVNELYKKQEEVEKNVRKTLKEKSDAQIEYMYRNRYNNPDRSSRAIELIEEEAARRGIS